MSGKTAEQIAEEALAKAKGKSNGKTPPPHVDRGEGAALLDDVRKFLGRFVAYPSDTRARSRTSFGLRTRT